METMEAILELRKKLNISQDEFARRLSVTRQAVSRWENGDTIPNIDTLKLIDETFEVSVDYLMGHTTMEEMIELNLRDLDEWNKSVGLQLTEQEARSALMEFLPTLKRWKDTSGTAIASE